MKLEFPRKRQPKTPRKNSSPVEREKLQWPAGRPRTVNRTPSRFFNTATGQRKSVTYTEALKRLKRELQAMGVGSVTVSSNHENAREYDDPGVALYFDLQGQPTCLSCDKWDRVADNIAALAAHVHATRGIERWGVGTVREAFSAYMALPPARVPDPYDVLGLPKSASRDEIDSAYKKAALAAHPDHGGSNEAMAALTAARDAALGVTT